MKFLPLSCSCALVLAASPLSLRAETDYPLTEDSKPNDAVPKGELIKFNFDQSTLFLGTAREVIVYVPRQYDGTKPACLYVNQDGLQWKADVVFDNLIAKGEMPVTIGVFVMPGVVKAVEGKPGSTRQNRSFEYDSLGDGYVRFLLDELLPEVEKKMTVDGRKILLSKGANDRAIGGSSSGAICAFNAAWERPDAFSRVFSSIGTFVSLRGADRFPGLIRKYEPKPLRVFLQDGSGDLNHNGGDWWMANQTMQRALEFCGYEHTHVWGDGGHNAKQGNAVFPEAMRFLWKGWPEPVKAGAGSKQVQEIAIPGEDWKLVWEGGKFTEGPAANAKGEVFFNDIPNSKTYRVALDGTVSEFLADSKRANGQKFGADGRLFQVAGAEPKIIAYDEHGSGTLLAEGLRGNDLAALHDGSIYVTEPSPEGGKGSNVWLISPTGEKRVVDTGLKYPNGIAVSPDQGWLYVDESRSHWIYSYQIQPDGSLAFKQRYDHLQVPDSADDSGADGMDVDTAGRLYVATRLGIQVCDLGGRVSCIFPVPNGKSSNAAFGGADFDTLYVTAGDRVFSRKLKVHGAPGFRPPIAKP